MKTKTNELLSRTTDEKGKSVEIPTGFETTIFDDNGNPIGSLTVHLHSFNFSVSTNIADMRAFHDALLNVLPKKK